MFILYTAELAALASKFDMKLYAFADDNQPHIHCDISNIISPVNALEECITAIGQWLQLNAKKLSWCVLAPDTASQIFSATTT